MDRLSKYIKRSVSVWYCLAESNALTDELVAASDLKVLDINKNFKDYAATPSPANSRTYVCKTRSYVLPGDRLVFGDCITAIKVGSQEWTDARQLITVGKVSRRDISPSELRRIKLFIKTPGHAI